MSTIIGPLMAFLTLDTTQFQAGMSKAQAATQQMATAANSANISFTTLLTTLGKFMVIGEVLQIVISGVKDINDGVVGLNSKLEAATMNWTRFTGSVDGAKAEVQELYSMATNSAFTFDQVNQATERFADLGHSTQAANQVIQETMNVITGLGRSVSSLNTVTTGFARLEEGGKLSMRGLQGAISAGIDVFPMLSQATGIAVDQIQKAISNGQITTKQFFDAYAQWSLQFQGAAEAQAHTFTGAMKAIGDSMQLAFATGFTPLYGAITNLANRVSAFVQSADFHEWVINLQAAMAMGMTAIGAIIPVFSTVFGTLVQIVSQAAMAIYGLMSFIDPFAHHSPSLVENVTLGVDQIINKYGDITDGIAGPLQAANAAMDSFVNDNMDAWNAYDAKQDESLDKTLAYLGDQIPAAYHQAQDAITTLKASMADLQTQIDDQVSAMAPLTQQLQDINDQVKTQDILVKQAENDEQGLNDTLSAAKSAYQPYADAIEKAKDAEADATDILHAHEAAIQNTVNAATDAKAAYDLANDSLQPFRDTVANTKMALDDATDSIEQQELNISSYKEAYDATTESVSLLNDQLKDAKDHLDEFTKAPIEGTKAYQDQLRAIGDQQDHLKMQIDSMHAGGASSNATSGLQKQLDELDARSQVLQEQHKIALEPVTNAAAQVAESTPEITSAAAIAGIQQYGGQVATLTVQLQQATVEQLNAKTAYDTVDAPIERQRLNLIGLKQAYDDANLALQHQIDLLEPLKDEYDNLTAASQAAEDSLQPYKDAQKLTQDMVDQQTAAGVGAANTVRDAQEGVDAYNNDVLRPLKDTYNDLTTQQAAVQAQYDIEDQKLKDLQGAYDDTKKEVDNWEQSLKSVVEAAKQAEAAAKAAAKAGGGAGAGIPPEGGGGISGPPDPDALTKIAADAQALANAQANLSAKTADIGQKFQDFGNMLRPLQPLIQPLLTEILALALYASPLGGILAGIATGAALMAPGLTALGVALVGVAIVANQMHDTFTIIINMLKTLWDRLTSGNLGGAFDELGRTIRVFFTGLGIVIGTDLQDILSKLEEWGSDILDWIQANAPAIETQLGLWANEFATFIGPALGELMSSLGSFISATLIPWIRQNVPIIAMQLWEWGKAFLGWALPALGSLMATFIAWFAGTFIPWLLGTALPAIIIQLQEWGIAFVSWAVPALAALLSSLWDWFNNQFIPWLGNTALPAIGAQMDSWGQAFQAWWPTAAGALFAALGSWVKNTFIPWLGSVKDDITGGLKYWGDAFLNWATTTTGQLFSNLGDWVRNTLIPWITGEDLRTSLGNALGSWKDTFSSGGTDAMGALLAALQVWISTTGVGPLQQLGVDIWSHILDGIKSVSSVDLGGIASNAASQAAAAKNSFDEATGQTAHATAQPAHIVKPETARLAENGPEWVLTDTQYYAMLNGDYADQTAITNDSNEARKAAENAHSNKAYQENAFLGSQAGMGAGYNAATPLGKVGDDLSGWSGWANYYASLQNSIPTTGSPDDTSNAPPTAPDWASASGTMAFAALASGMTGKNAIHAAYGAGAYSQFAGMSAPSSIQPGTGPFANYLNLGQSPGTNTDKFNDIPILDDGGIINSDTIARLSKNNKPEAVIPLNQASLGGGHTTGTAKPLDADSIKTAFKGMNIVITLDGKKMMTGTIEDLMRDARSAAAMGVTR